MIGYKQSDVGTIPNEWEAKSLIEIGETLIGLTYSPLEVRKYGTLVLRSSNVQNGILCFENKVFVEAKIPERIMVRPGDILICVRNGSRDLIGKSAMIDERAIGMTFGAFMGVFRSDFGNFLKHMFQSGILKKQINEHLGATINQITNSSLNSFKVPFPQSSEERSEIANTLNDFDKLLSVLDQVIAKKRNLKQATMQQLLNGRTRLPGFIGKWETKAFKHLLVRLHIKSHQIYTSNYQVSGKFPIVDQGKKLIVGFSDQEDKHFQPPEGGVIVFGDHTCIVKFIDFDFLMGADGIQVLHGKTGQNTRFYAFLLQYQGVKPTGYNRHFKFLKEREFVSPPLAEQIAIAKVLSDMDTELAILEARRDKTRNLKNAMMQELLTGKTRLMKSEKMNA
jgi:type I restriction enzyme, S subunit